MLAQNFKTPVDLGISDKEFDALAKVLGMLERGEIDRKHFDMNAFRSDCGTIGCICGWAYFVSNKQAFPEVGYPKYCRAQPLSMRIPRNLKALFGIDGPVIAAPEQAAIALRNYLTTGEPRWDEALA